MLRGTVDNGIFPLTGYDPMDVAFWRERLKIYRDYGLNHVRFHSWCPPDAAFTAADELGMLFQVANPLWIGDGGYRQTMSAQSLSAMKRTGLWTPTEIIRPSP